MPCQIIVRQCEKVNDNTIQFVWSTFAPHCLCGETIFNRLIKDINIESLYKKNSTEFDNKKVKDFLLNWMDKNDD